MDKKEDNKAQVLLSTLRNGYLDSCYFGSVYLANKDSIYKQIGFDKSTVCFMRSLAKPLQASIICDANIIQDYNLQDKELAIFCASHAGSSEHIKILKDLCKRFKIKQSDFELIAQKPLDLRGFKGRITPLHNNCSGKHLMMLLMSKYLKIDFKNYTNENHPIQKLILKKQNELSGFNSDILTYDGCSTPLWGLPVKNIIKAYFNFFHNEKYSPLIKAIINNPYIFGGFDRLDTEIIRLSNKKLFSKVGAGGFVLVYNFESDEILILKITQNNNPIRKLILMDILNKLNWLNSDIEEFEYNQKNQKVAKYCYEFSF